MKKNKTAWLGLIIVGLLLLLFLDKCNDGSTEPNIKETFETDTTKVTIIDTIPFVNIVDSIRWKTLPIMSISANEDSTLFTYNTDMSDSLLDGTINTVVKSDGTLVNQGFIYIPKFPKYITRTDSVIVTNTITRTIQEPDWGIYGGLDIVPYKQFALVPNIGLKTKQDMFFGVGYDPFNQNVHFQFKMKIFGK